MLHLGVLACALRAFRGVRLLLITHGIEVWTGVRNLRRKSLSAVDTILCVSDYTRQMMRSQAPELDEARFSLFPNALSESWLARQAQAERVSLETTSTVRGRFILSVARLSRYDRMKGILSVIEALPMLEDREVSYVVAGQGDDMEFLRRTAQRCGVEHRVHFLGSVTDETLVDLYRRCEAFVLPSGQEGFGIVFLEAMYFGAPVIAARAKGAVDVVQDGETGLLVAFGDVVALKEAVDRLLSTPALRQQLRERARANVTGEGPFTFHAFVQRCSTLLGDGNDDARQTHS
jgi:glycosyltransferase involved in cell wall biosynthesis